MQSLGMWSPSKDTAAWQLAHQANATYHNVQYASAYYIHHRPLMMIMPPVRMLPINYRPTNRRRSSSFGLVDDVSYHNANRDFEHEVNRTNLATAIKSNDAEAVQCFLDAEAPHEVASVLDNNGFLHMAAYYSNSQIIQLLINAGADVDALDRYLYTPIDKVLQNIGYHKAKHTDGIDNYNHQEFMECCASSVEVLLKAGANVNYLNKNSATYLFRAVVFLQAFPIVSVLLDFGAKRSLLIRENRRILEIFVHHRQFELAKRFVEEAGIDIRTIGTDDYENNVLSYAIIHKDYNMAKLFIDNGILEDFNARLQRCPLCAAIEMEHREMFDLIFTPMVEGHFEQLNQPHNFTCLQTAAKFKQLYMLKKLLEAGADVNAVTQGVNALYYAANTYYDSEPDTYNEILKLLLIHGTDVNKTTTDSGDAAFSYVLTHGNEEVVRLFLERNVDMYTNERENGKYPSPLYKSVYNKDKRVFNLIARSKQIDIQAKTPAGQNILHCIASDEGVLEGVEYLCRKGIDVNCQSTYGFTPLYYAISMYTDRVIPEETSKYIELLLFYNTDIHNSSHSYLQQCTPDNVDRARNRIIVHSVMKYLVLGEEEGKVISEFDRLYIRSRADLRNMCNNYKFELKNMKQYHIQDNVTVFDVLVNVKAYGRNRNVIDALADEEVLKLFELYRDVLVKRFAIVRERAILEDRANSGLRKILDWEVEAYPMIFKKISTFLDDDTLKILIDL